MTFRESVIPNGNNSVHGLPVDQAIPPPVAGSPFSVSWDRPDKRQLSR